MPQVIIHWKKLRPFTLDGVYFSIYFFGIFKDVVLGDDIKIFYILSL